MWAATVQRDVYRAEYAAIWNDTATSRGQNGEPEGMVDVILCPVGPGAAPKIDTSKWWGYTSQWNLLDYPALVFPVDRVDSEKDGEKVEYEPRNEKDKFNWDLWEQHGGGAGLFAAGGQTVRASSSFLSIRSFLYEEVGEKVLIVNRYEDEKVIQALQLLQKEAGFPFVEYI